MADAVSVTVDTASFGELFGRASRVEPALRTALRRRIRNAAKGLAGEVKAEALLQGEGSGTAGRLGLRRIRPNGRSSYLAFRRDYTYAASSSGRSTGLRQGIAAKVGVAVVAGATRQGVRITSNGNMAGAWQAKSWRHPVFGTRAQWVQQAGRPGYFYTTIGRGAAVVQNEIKAAMQEAAKSLGDNG